MFDKKKDVCGDMMANDLDFQFNFV